MITRDIWIVSDTHFGHANMLKFRNRDGSLTRPEFSSVKEMDEKMEYEWNAAVKPTDKVYHCGDVGFGVETYRRIMPRLQGHKRLILGNHDKFDMRLYTAHFDQILMWRRFTEDDVGIVLSHVPLHKESLLHGYDGRCINAHGHIHGNVIDDPTYVNVCVEHTGYAPVHLDTLLAKARTLARANGFTTR